MTQTCYMCDQTATSAEHVPPKCFFPEQKDMPGKSYRENLITVPSCDQHNSAKSKDDEYLLGIIAAHFENNFTAIQHYSTKILRALKKSPGFAAAITAAMQPASLDGVATGAISVDMARFNDELEKMARGLFFHEQKRKFDGEIAIHALSMLVQEVDGAEGINADIACLSDFTERFMSAKCQQQGQNPDIFHYRFYYDQHKPQLIILMTFYASFKVVALAGNTPETTQR